MGEVPGPGTWGLVDVTKEQNSVGSPGPQLEASFQFRGCATLGWLNNVSEPRFPPLRVTLSRCVELGTWRLRCSPRAQ